MKTARKVFAFTVALLTELLTVQPAFAAQVTRLNVELSDSRPSTSNSHTWSFTHTQAATLKSITFSYCRTPSGGCTRPTGLTTTTAVEGTISGLTGASWTLNAAGEQPRLEAIIADGEAIAAGTPVSIQMTTITNNPIATSNCSVASNNSAATCYVSLATYTDVAGTGLVDEGIASYTVVAAVTVTARVDPTFTFVVSANGASQVHNGITTSVASTYNELNFGNLTAGTPKYAAQALNVTTNTENGYTVTMKMLTQMTGAYTSNNIDPFVGTNSVWGTPQDWSEPNGDTANDNTAWIGANTTDSDVAGWSGTMTGKFGPVQSTANQVMKGLRSDNGTSAVYVTYAIEANVFQPADTYTGTIVYNALPTY